MPAEQAKDIDSLHGYAEVGGDRIGQRPQVARKLHRILRVIRSPGNRIDEVVRRALQEAVVRVARQDHEDAHVAGRAFRELPEICDQGRRDASSVTGHC